jgi:hypothetical protein
MRSHLLDFRETISERFPAALPMPDERFPAAFATHDMKFPIAIFPRSKMTITIKDGGRHPPYQSKKARPRFRKI